MHSNPDTYDSAMPACCWLYDENINYEEEKLGMGPSIYAHDTTVYKAKIVQIPKYPIYAYPCLYNLVGCIFLPIRVQLERGGLYY